MIRTIESRVTIGLLLAGVSAGCGSAGGESGADRVMIERDAGSLLRDLGVTHYAYRDDGARVVVQLFGGELELGAMDAFLENGHPSRVELDWKEVQFEFVRDEAALMISRNGSAPERWTAGSEGWRGEAAGRDPQVLEALELVGLLSVEITGGEPADPPADETAYSSQTGSCSDWGPLQNCGAISACAVGNAFARCSGNGGYLIGVACSCSWWSSYCQATVHCY